LISPATFLSDETGARKLKSHVELVHFLMLDFDDVTPQAFGAVLAKVEQLGLAACAYSTWKQPEAAQQGLARIRLVILTSRPAAKEEWPAIYRAAIAEFGASALDTSCSDANRFYFTPALPVGSEHAASSWSSEGSGAWDVDNALRNAPAVAAGFGLGADTSAPATDPVPKEAIARLAVKLAKAANPKSIRMGNLLRAGLDGHQLAETGGRHVVLRDLAWQLGQTFPTGNPYTIAEPFKCSLDFMREAGAEKDPLDHFVELIESAQAKVHEQEQALEQARVSAKAKKIQVAWEGFGSDRTTAYTPFELKEFEADGGLLDGRWIVQCGEAVWLLFDGAYRGPFQRSAIPTAVSQLLAPAESAGVQVYEVDEKGSARIKPLEKLVSQYGRLVEVVESDMSAPRTYLEPRRSAIVEAPCPVRTDVTPRFDADVDAWLKLLAGPKYERLCDWIATVTWLRECAPAVFLKGASGTGKNLLALGLSRLWTPSGFTPMQHALGQFNASITRCPLVYADERIPETFKGEPRTEELRELITTSTFQINQKNRPLVTCYGSARILIGANNFGIISRKAEFTPEDAQALADRFILIDVGTEQDAPAREWLKSRGGPEFTRDWVIGDRIASHALWLRDEVESGRRKLVRGSRLVVPGDAAELLSALQTGSRTPWNVLSWIWSFLQDQSKHIAACVGRPFAVITHGERVWVSTRHLLQSWDHYLPGERAPSLESLTNTMRNLLLPKRETRYRPRREKTQDLTYLALRLDQLRTWLEQQGEDVSELDTLLQVETMMQTGPGQSPLAGQLVAGQPGRIHDAN
jgi:hypothetical protein